MKKTQNKKRRIFNRLGMTYIELLTALALLSLIIVAFTPMLLQSYEWIYEAGEINAEAYTGREEMEVGLAKRTSTDTSKIPVSFSLNSQNFFTNLNVEGRKVVSSVQQGLETVFNVSKARIQLVSPNLVYDDILEHEVLLQTTGLAISEVKTSGKPEDLENYKNNAKRPVLLKAYVPYKTVDDGSGTTTEEVVYGTQEATITGALYDEKTGRIKFTVGGADFTDSPIRINIYYLNQRGIVKMLSEYLYIEPATMILAGKANNYDYYTSAGIVENTGKGSNTDTTYTFQVLGRTMTLDNSDLFDENADSPSKRGVTINTITWVSNDENPYLNKYYVLAGTNGSVYRMYNMKSIIAAEDSYETVKDGDQEIKLPKTLTFRSMLNASNSGAISDTSDGSYRISSGEVVHPSFWSGEVADQFCFKSGKEGGGYGIKDNTQEYKDNLDCTTTNVDGGSRIGTRYNYFDKNLKYSFMYSGYNMSFKYQSQASRRISYVLTEAGDHSFRVGGKKDDENDFGGYTARWEWGDSQWITLYRRSLGQYNTSDDRVIYWFSGGSSNNYHQDRHFAFLRLKAYTSVDPIDLMLNDTYGGHENCFRKGDFWFPNDDSDIVWEDDFGGNSNDKTSKNNWDLTSSGDTWLTSDYGNSANVTSVVYLPGASSTGGGQLVYFGYVPAYAYLMQRSDIKTEVITYYNNNNSKNPYSVDTSYVISGSYETTTSVLRRYNGNHSDGHEARITSEAIKTAIANKSIKETDNVDYFYNNQYTSNDQNVYQYNYTDLAFTFGYCSRWRMAIGEVTSHGPGHEETTSYEKFYVLSHEGKRPNYGSIYDNRQNSAEKPSFTRIPSTINGAGTDNIFYNVWFPGEYYNLTKVATCDEVTVAVGYTVSGGAFMKESSYVGNGYYGTALGDIYNDAVLAAYTNNGDNTYNLDSSAGGKTTVFQNLLYYKSPTFIDANRHSRKSVRFEAVAVNSETITSNNTGSKKYFAYYADNEGNLYRSLVATAEVKKVTVNNSQGKEDQDAIQATETVSLVSYIADTASTSNETSMNPVYLDANKTKQFKDVFSKILSIEAEEDLIIVMGIPKSGDTFMYVGVRNDVTSTTTNADGEKITSVVSYTWSWRGIKIKNYNYASGIKCATINKGYYYFAGETTGTAAGFISGVSLDVLKNPSATSLTNEVNSRAVEATLTTSTEGSVKTILLKDAIYAMDGRETT